MVVLSRKDANISYQNGKKRHLNENFDCLTPNLNHETANDILIKNNLDGKIKRYKHSNNQTNNPDDPSKNKYNFITNPDFLDQKEIIRPSLLSNNEKSEELKDNDKSNYNKRSENEIQEMNDLDTKDYYSNDDSDVSFVDYIKIQQNSDGFANIATTSTPIKNCYNKTGSKEYLPDTNELQTHIIAKNENYFNYIFQEDLPILPTFNTHGVYMNEKRKLTPYSKDIFEQEYVSMLEYENNPDENHISSSNISVIDSL